MRYDPSQNTGSNGQFVLVGAPKRKGPTRKLQLCTRRYSKKRLGRMRIKQYKAWKEYQATLQAAQQAAAENAPPTSASNEQQCDNEDKVSKEEMLETEEDFAASISVVFNVLDGTYTIKDENTDRDKKQFCVSSQGSDNAFGGVKADTLTIDSSQAEEMQCEELEIASAEGNCYGVEKVENFEENSREELEAASDEEDYYIVEKVPKNFEKKEPYRSDNLCIVDMEYLFEQIKVAGNHSKRLDCSTEHLEVLTIKKAGLKNTLVLKCAMCHYQVDVHSLPPDHTRMDINYGAVIGTIATGGGYAQLEQLLAAINVSAMPVHAYQQCHDYVVNALINAAEIEMVAAAEEEKKLAIERGDVLPSGIPYIPVIADGCWMKRSYGTGKFDSPAGCGVIIGYYSKKVLFIGVRNKNCSICYYAEKKNTPTRSHRCFRNWDHNQPSTKMESDAILEGFRTSVATRGLIYSALIADGDSSSYRRILDCDPYEGMVRVSKIECTNHLLRNFCKKMRDVVKKTSRSKYKKTVDASVTKMRTAIACAAKFRRKENVHPSQQLENLKMDIMNVPSHIFGEHKECQKIGYFCDGAAKGNEQNIVPELMKLGIYQRIQEILQPLLAHAQSLLLNRTNNLVESFNSVIAKYIGAKRVNFSQRGSYMARCSAAVVQFNTKELLSRLHKVMKKEPSSVIRGLEMRKNHKVRDSKKRKSTVTPRHVRKLIYPEDDPDYGPNALQPDIEPLPEFQIEVERERCESQNCSQSETLMERVGVAEENSAVPILPKLSQNYSYQIHTALKSEMCESQSCSHSETLTECVGDAEENSAVAILPILPQNISYQIQAALESEMCESQNCSESETLMERVGDAEEDSAILRRVLLMKN